jgi:bacterioferritin-associated ferredoxin
MYVCICAGVTDRQIKQAAREGACSVDQLATCLGVGTVCGCCREMAQELLGQAEPAIETTITLHHVREVARLAVPARPV